MDEHGRLYYAKAATTKDDFAIGMFEALSVLAEECGTSVSELISSSERFSLGTTVGTNLLVERRGARTGLLATAGHGDAILIMRGTGRTAGLEQYPPSQATSKPFPRPRLIERSAGGSTAWGRSLPREAAMKRQRNAGGELCDCHRHIAFLWSLNPAWAGPEIVRRWRPTCTCRAASGGTDGRYG
jgi:hypothetical protein